MGNSADEAELLVLESVKAPAKPKPSAFTQFIISHFSNLSQKRQYAVGMAAIGQPIQYMEMKAYFDLIDIKPDLYFIEMLNYCDSLTLRLAAEERD